MKIASTTEVISFLENHPNKGAKIVGLTTVTSPKMLAKSRLTGLPNPYKDGILSRKANRTVILGSNYENLVNKARENEGNEVPFTAEALWKGKGEKAGKYTVRHKGTGEVYFAYLPKVSEPEHTPTVNAEEWLFNNKPLTSAAIEQLKAEFLPLPSESKKQDVEKTVFWQTVKLENVVEVRYAGESLVIDHNAKPTITVDVSKMLQNA